MVDTSKLAAEAAAISSSSPKIRTFAMDAAANLMDQAAHMAALEAKVAKLSMLPAPAPPVPAQAVYFAPVYADGGLGEWPDLHDVVSNSTMFQGATNDIIPALPGAEGARVMRVRVDQTLADSSVCGDAGYVAQLAGPAWERVGQTTRYRMRVLFPSGTDPRYPGKYTLPKPPINPAICGGGGWSTQLEWHEPGGFPSSPQIGVHQAGFLRMQWSPGGVLYYDHDPAGATVPFLPDHWYEWVFVIKWSQVPVPQPVTWWVDGRQAFPPADGFNYGSAFQSEKTLLPTNFATWHANADGSPAYGWLEAGHYRSSPPAPAYVDTLYIDAFKIEAAP